MASIINAWRTLVWLWRMPRRSEFSHDLIYEIYMRRWACNEPDFEDFRKARRGELRLSYRSGQALLVPAREERP